MMAGEVQFSCGPVQAGLRNPLILEHIFQYSNARDLQKCRRVCKLWRSSCLKSWRSSVVMEIFRNDKMSDFVSFYRLINPSDSTQYFTNFHLQSIDFHHETGTLAIFWRVLGPQIRILKLTECLFPGGVNAIQHAIFKFCPKLQQLHINSIEMIERDRPYYRAKERSWEEPKFGENKNLNTLCVDPYFKWNTGITWMELFSHFPSIEVFKLIGDIPCYAPYDDLFQAIINIRRHDKEKLKLREIHVRREHEKNASPPIPDTLFNLLLDEHLHLKKLSITLNQDDNASRLSQILAQHGESLQMLELSARRFNNVLNAEKCFPSSPLENLVELKLHFRMFTSLNVLKYTPNLRKLAIFESPSSITEATHMEDLQNVKLEKCVALEVRNWLSLDELRKLVELLPSLERLRMPLDNATFELVCAKWTKLLLLEIIDCDIDDQGITGLSAETVQKVNAEEGKFVLKTVDREKPNITDLKYLQRLYFYCVDRTPRHPPMLYVPRFRLGFCAAQYGVAKIPNLQYLQIENYDRLAIPDFWDDLLFEFEWGFDSMDEVFIRRDLLEYP